MLAIALVVGACGSDDDEPTADGSVTSDQDPSGDSSDDGADIAGSADDADLLVPRDYLQGAWCDSDGQSWTIEGDAARFVDASGGTAEFPVDIVFIDGPDESLVSQSDDEFVIMSLGEEITFSRGAC